MEMDRLQGIETSVKAIADAVKELVEIAKGGHGEGEDGKPPVKRKRVEPQAKTVSSTSAVSAEGNTVMLSKLGRPWKNTGGLEFAYTYVLEDFKKASTGTFSFHDVELYDAKQRTVPPPPELKGIIERHRSFKPFDSVSDHSDHWFSDHTLKEPLPVGWVAKLMEEWKDLEKRLPENMLVRAYEGRVDLLRAVIIGPHGTPYHDGLFFFDVHFPSTYPATPPLAHYYSYGLSVHENVNRNGSICLLQTVRDGGTPRNETIWVPGTSNMRSFLGFLNSLFCAEPLLNGYTYNDPKMFDGVPSPFYNELAFIKSVKTMVTLMNEPPSNFEEFVTGHFHNRAADIVKACHAYMVDGVQVGCLVDGLPKEGNKGIVSTTFVKDLAPCIKPLVAAFERIGAKIDEHLIPPS